MSSFQNGTYGLGTVLTADRETLDSDQPSKKARVLPPTTSANEAIQFHFVDSWKQVRTLQGPVLHVHRVEQTFRVSILCTCQTHFTRGRQFSIGFSPCSISFPVRALRIRNMCCVQIPNKQQDLDRETGSAPLFTNQVFEEEEIQGYQGLSIDVVLDLQQFIPRMFHKHSFKADKRADDCVSLIGAHFTEGLPIDQAACAAMHVCSCFTSALPKLTH